MHHLHKRQAASGSKAGRGGRSASHSIGRGAGGSGQRQLVAHPLCGIGYDTPNPFDRCLQPVGSRPGSGTAQAAVRSAVRSTVSKTTHLLLRPVQVVLILLRSQVPRIRVVLHQLVHVPCCFVEDVPAAWIGPHVCLAHVVGLGIDVDRAVGICRDTSGNKRMLITNTYLAPGTRSKSPAPSLAHPSVGRISAPE